jgi:hypothetical protein
MAVPSKNFTEIQDTAIDADSPITEGLMTNFRDNDIYLEEWLGKDYTAAQNHDHDGVNSALVQALITEYKSGVETVNDSVTLQDDDDLFFSINALSRHYFEMMLLFSTSSSADFKWDIIIPTGSINYRYAVYDDTSNALVRAGIATAGTPVSLNVSNTGDYYVIMSGICFTGVTGGTFQLQWAQGTSIAVDTDVNTGSYLAHNTIVVGS